MYVNGACPDYRWTHDNEAPTASQLAHAILQLQSADLPRQVQLHFKQM